MTLSGIDNGTLIAAIALLAASFVLVRFSFGNRSFRRSRSWGYSNRSNTFRGEQNSAVYHFGQQLQAVMTSPFERQRIMNASEYRTFRMIEDEIASARKGYRVFAQTSLGEVLQSKDEDAFFSINSKRVDILIVDQGGWPVLAVEHQGEGHYKGTAAARDAIKKEALRKAGVRYLEVVPGDSEEQIRHRVREHLGLDRSTSTPPSPPAPSPRTGYGLRTAAH